MKLKIPFITAILLFLLSCNEQQEQTRPVSFAPKVVEAHGYIVPKDSLAAPRVIIVNEKNMKNIPVRVTAVVLTNTNVHPAGIPKVVIAGVPKVCTPGQDGFSMPETLPAIDHPFMAGIPEVVIAKEAYSKDQNPQNFSSFGKLQGLKHSNIISLAKDKNGNLWFGTFGGGVSKYDGKSFTNFTGSEGLSNPFVRSIVEDKSGNLWFATGGGGVSKYNGKSFTNFTQKEGLTNNDVWDILEDKEGNLWFGTLGGGVSKYDGKNFTNFTKKEGLGNDDVRSIVEDRRGNLWFGTLGGGVSKYDGKSFTNFTKKEGLSNDAVWCILEDKTGMLWFGTLGGGVNRYDGKRFTHITDKEGLSNNSVWSMLEDKSGNLWLGTNGGVNKFDGNSFTHFTDKEGLTNNVVRSILQDNNGNLWFATFGGGVCKYNGNRFTHFTEKEGLLFNAVWSILQDKSGNIWFGTFGKGMCRYDGKSFTHFTEEEGPYNNYLRSILEDKSGNLWFSSGMGASKFDGKNITNFTGKEGLSGHIVRCILEDHSSNLWFGTEDDGVFKYDGKSFTHFTEKEGLKSNYISSMLEDKSGNLWFGGDGLSKYDSKNFTHFTDKEGLSNMYINSIMEDKNGNLWFGTYGGGINKYDGKSFTHFTEKEGLSNNIITSSMEDKNGNLWFGTRFGLNKLEKDKISAFNFSESSVFFTTYTYEDGFSGIGVNFGKTIYEAADGTIWIGADDRVTAFHPSEENPDTIPPNIQVTGLALFNENIPWQNLEKKKDTSIVLGNGVTVHDFHFDDVSKWYGLPENLSLAYDNNYLTFNFVGITIVSPKKVKYQYKLEGLDKNWSALTNRSEAPYGNLPHARYTFKVKAMNGEGYWSKEFQYAFTIRPPWWKTWLAWLSYILVIGFAIWSYIQYRERSLQAQKQVLEETVSIRTNQLKHKTTELEEKSTVLEHSLSSLKATQAQLIQSEKMASLGELTAGIAHEIQNPLNFVNNFSEVSNELITEMSNELDKRDIDEAKVIANDIKQNLEKISQHGKRADAIVKGMLQHSQTSTGKKEPTDINKLAEEYLRLSYHGMCAKDKSFNVTLKTDFDESIGTINVIPQDIGRVVLNLVNNAFYVVDEKKKQIGEGYEPTVSVSTKKTNGKVEIKVSDNGSGIPQKVMDKIFQPFFTTKPTGQGTGLGLSLSYDIVKAHGGDIRVESVSGEAGKEGGATIFIIELPV